MGNPRANCAEYAKGFSSPLSKNSNYNRMYQDFFLLKVIISCFSQVMKATTLGRVLLE